MVADVEVQKLVQDMNNVRVGLLPILCLEALYKEEADKEDIIVSMTLNAKVVKILDKKRFFQKKWFYLKGM